MRKLRQLYLGYLSLFLLLFSTIGWGQVNITNNDAYYKIDNTTDPILGNYEYLIGDRYYLETKVKLAGDEIETRSSEKRLDADPIYRMSDGINGSNQYIMTSLNEVKKKWFISKLEDGSYSFLNASELKYLSSEDSRKGGIFNAITYRDLSLLGTLEDKGKWNITYEDNSYIIRNKKTNFYLYVDEISDYIKASNSKPSRSTLGWNEGLTFLFRKLRLNIESHIGYIGETKYLPYLSEDGTIIQYSFVRSFDDETVVDPSTLVTKQRAANSKQPFLYQNTGEIFIKALVPQKGKRPAYYKIIRVDIQGDNSCFREGFNNGIGDYNSNNPYIEGAAGSAFTFNFPHRVNVSSFDSGVRIGKNSSNLSDNRGALISRELNHLSGNLNVQLKLKVNDNKRGQKVRIGFLKQGSATGGNTLGGILSDAHYVKVGDNYKYFDVQVDKTLSDNEFHTISYNFTEIPAGSKFVIETWKKHPVNNESSSTTVYVDEILINCEPKSNVTTWRYGYWDNSTPDETMTAHIWEDLGQQNVIAKKVIVEGDVKVSKNNYIEVHDELIEGDNDENNIKRLTFEKGAYLEFKNNVTNNDIKANVVFESEIDHYKYDTRIFSSPVRNSNTKLNFGTGNVIISEFNPGQNKWINLQSNDLNNSFVLGRSYAFQRTDGNEFWSNRDENNTVRWKGAIIGLPNTGDVTFELPNIISNRGKSFSLGNPYTVPLDIMKFLTTNSNIEMVRIWRNDNPMDFKTYNYYHSQLWYDCKRTVGCNNTLTKTSVDVGVGFLARVTSNASNGQITFNNSMKKSYMVKRNDELYQHDRVNSNKQRFILTLNKDNSELNSSLIGFIPDATLEYDEDFDVKSSINNSILPLSFDETYSILAESYPLDENKIIKLRLNSIQNSNLIIKLKEFDEEFLLTNNIYLKDNFTGSFTNLIENREYNFETISGIFDDRFEIHFKDSVLNNEDLSLSNGIKVYKSNGLNFITSKEIIKDYKIYDSSSRIVKQINNVNNSNIQLPLLIQKGMYIIELELNNGDIRKIKFIN